MNFLSKTHLKLLLCAAVAPMATGCGGNSSEPTQTASSDSPAATSTAGAADSVTTTQATVVDGKGTAPAQTVAIFLDSLRRGDETAANAVLTTKAREELSKTAYVIQPLGTPEGQYTIGRVGFPYEEKNVALVECVWNEPAVGQEPAVSMEIVCEVHEELEGWRISGLGVSITGTEEALVLDFENAASLQATIDAATGQPSTPQAPTGNEMTAAAGQQFPSLPALPGQSPGQAQTQFQNQSVGQEPMPNGLRPSSPTQGNVDQTAYPALNNGPIYR